jgi:hypothetical protein
MTIEQLKIQMNDLEDELDEHMKEFIDILSKKRKASKFVECAKNYLKDKLF